MKHIFVVGAALGLMTSFAAAETLSAKGPGVETQQQVGEDYYGHAPASARSFVANASYYGGGPRRFEPNAHTASGERFDQWGLTAAHRTLPLGTRLLVTHGGRSVVVRVNDRGPAAWTGRSLDLSRGAATRLGLIASGTGPVLVQVLGGG